MCVAIMSCRNDPKQQSGVWTHGHFVHFSPRRMHDDSAGTTSMVSFAAHLAAARVQK